MNVLICLFEIITNILHKSKLQFFRSLSILKFAHINYNKIISRVRLWMAIDHHLIKRNK